MAIGKCNSCNNCQKKSYFIWLHSSAMLVGNYHTPSDPQQINKKAQILKNIICRGPPALDQSQENTGGREASAAGMLL